MNTTQNMTRKMNRIRGIEGAQHYGRRGDGRLVYWAGTFALNVEESAKWAAGYVRFRKRQIVKARLTAGLDVPASCL